MAIFAPIHDNKIYQKYSKKNLQNKEKNKIAFCQDFGLEYDKKTALLCLTFPLIEENNINILIDVMGGILEQNVAMVLTGVGIKKYQAFFTELAHKYPEKIIILSDNEINKRKIYAATDIFLATSKDKECMLEMETAMNYGVIPIAPPNNLAQDYDLEKEQGNAFIYKEKSPWSFFAGLIRALESFKFPYDWKTIQVTAMGGEDEEEEE